MDSRSFTPILACAKDNNVAFCMANMLEEYFKAFADSEEVNRVSKSFGRKPYLGFLGLF